MLRIILAIPPSDLQLIWILLIMWRSHVTKLLSRVSSAITVNKVTHLCYKVEDSREDRFWRGIRALLIG